jgi:hypothetical protein
VLETILKNKTDEKIKKHIHEYMAITGKRYIGTHTVENCISNYQNLYSFLDSTGPIPSTKSCVILFISTNATPSSFATLREESR